MPDLYWLRLVLGTVLELRSLKDYGGQPLVFSSPAFMRMRVTKDTLDSELVQRYIAMGMLTYELDAEHSAPAAASAPAPVAAPPPPPAPEPAPEPEVPPVLETPSEVSPELAVAPAAEPAAEPAPEPASEPTKKTPRRR